MYVKLKKSDFIILTILLFTVSILALVICNIKWEIITLGPNEETKVHVNGHSESLDSIIHVEVIPVTTYGKIKLSRDDDWFDPEKGIGYNVKDSQIETYHYNEKTQSWDVTMLGILIMALVSIAKVLLWIHLKRHFFHLLQKRDLKSK